MPKPRHFVVVVLFYFIIIIIIFFYFRHFQFRHFNFQKKVWDCSECVNLHTAALSKIL